MSMQKAERARINAQGFTWIARGQFGWGEGETPEKAIRRAKTQSTKGSEITLFRCSPNAFVDGYGRVKCDPNWEPKVERSFITDVTNDRSIMEEVANGDQAE